MFAQTIGVFLVMVYYITVLYVGIMSGRKINLKRAMARSQSQSQRSSLQHTKTLEGENWYLINLFLAERAVGLFVGVASLAGR